MPRLRRIGGQHFPHRTGRVQDAFEDSELERVMVCARALEVKVYRMDPLVWRFKGGPGKVDITTTTPQTLTWEDLFEGSV